MPIIVNASWRATAGRRGPRQPPERKAIARLEAIAWAAYSQSRKAPVTRTAGPGIADPDYDLPTPICPIKRPVFVQSQ